MYVELNQYLCGFSVDDDDDECDSDDSDEEDNGEVSLSEVYNDDLEEDNSDWEGGEGEGGEDDEDEDSDIDDADGDANESAASVKEEAKDGEKAGGKLNNLNIIFQYFLIIFQSPLQMQNRKPGARRESMMVRP